MPAARESREKTVDAVRASMPDSKKVAPMKDLPYKKVRSGVDRRSGDSRRKQRPHDPGTEEADRRVQGEKRREWKRAGKWSSRPLYDYKY